MCDEIYTKEIREYTADDIAILWLTLSDCLHKYVKEGGDTNTFLGGTTIFGSYLTEELTKTKTKEILKTINELNPFTINAQGRPVIDIRNPRVMEMMKKFSNEYIADRELKFDEELEKESNGTIVRRIIAPFSQELMNLYNEIHPNAQIPTQNRKQYIDANQADDIILFILSNQDLSSIPLYHEYLGFFGEILKCYWESGAFDNGFLGRKQVDNFVKQYMQVRNAAKLGPDRTIFATISKMYDKLTNVENFIYYINVGKYKRMMFAKLPKSAYLWARFKTYEYNANKYQKTEVDEMDKEKIDEYVALKTLQFNEITTFYTITKAYSIVKFIFTTLIPKRLINLLFDTDNSYNLLDEVLSITAGVLLGPRYLATEVSGETAGEIIQEYLKVESKAPDPFITKYMEDQKFIKEEEAPEKFNVFISNKDFTELQKEFLEEKMKELGKKRKFPGVPSGHSNFAGMARFPGKMFTKFSGEILELRLLLDLDLM